MASVDEIYRLWKYILKKNQQDGYAAPSDFNLTFNTAQKSYASWLLGSFQQYTPGRPIARVELGQNSVVRTRLTPIIYNVNLSIDANGFKEYPGDYMQVDAMWSMYGFSRIRFADSMKFVSMYSSRIDPIRSNPIYRLEDVGFRFYPQDLGTANLNYVRDPPDVVWGYDLDSNGIPVYNAAKSTDPVWDDASLLDILVRSLSIVGVNLNAGVVMQYSQEIKNQGQ